MTQKKTALVLSGGAARGAYEVGVIRYLREELPRLLGHQPRFDILTGASVGAVHAAFMAATAEQPASQGQRLAEIWSKFRLEQTLTFHRGGALRLGKHLWEILRGRERNPETPLLGGIIDTTSLSDVVLRHIPWNRISINLRDQCLEALTVSAFDLSCGRTTVFVQRHDGQAFPIGEDLRKTAVAARIGPAHVLGSSAVPFAFSPVRIGGSWYCDGGVRQSTPLSPALRLGATQVLVVSLEGRPSPIDMRRRMDAASHQVPSTLFVAGRVAGGILLGSVDYDIKVMRRINALVESVEQSQDQKVGAGILGAIAKRRGLTYRRVEPILLRPTVDVGAIASDYISKIMRQGRYPRWATQVLAALSEVNEGGEADLVSYVLFDGDFAKALIDLGFEDARRHSNALAAFFERADT